ncbi:MAG: NTP transferase domain-containing protein [Methanomassiliicoccaceae archaeon]|jgi:adenosylcobinamide-phosphate guanylyltransferase|nr:NTP transferase domain-containing protein [Methanomassiliicoccaceae archaeon]
MMEALVNAGGKGTRMGRCGTEKPMHLIGGMPVVKRVVDALSSSENIDRVIVSVSANTKETAKYLRSEGIETVTTSGNDFMNDLHTAFEVMNGRFVMTAPSDMPLLMRHAVDTFYNFFDPDTMESAIAVVNEDTVRSVGISPSYSVDINGRRWVLSGLCIMDRIKTLDDVFLGEAYMQTDMFELAVNVNTQDELELARKMISHRSKSFL